MAGVGEVTERPPIQITAVLGGAPVQSLPGMRGSALAAMAAGIASVNGQSECGGHAGEAPPGQITATAPIQITAAAPIQITATAHI